MQCANHCPLHPTDNYFFNLQFMIIRDAGIFSPKVDASNQLCFTVKLKKEDWNEVLKELIYASYNEGKTLDFEIIGMSNELPDVMIKLRGDLGALMHEYCSRNKIMLETETNALYARNKVSSRRDLTRSQLDSEISRYKTGLDYNL